jgi:hypothetical protein
MLPKDGYQHAIVAYFCALNSQRERATVEAAQALQLMPHHSDTLWMAALAYDRAGERAAALKALQAAPRPLLEDLRRWPEASALTSAAAYSQLIASAR